MNHQTHQILFTLNLFFVLHYQMKWSALFYLIKLNWRNHFENLLVHNQQIKVYKSKKIKICLFERNNETLNWEQKNKNKIL